MGIVPSEEYTSIELTGTDRPGLLSEVCAVLVVMGCAVQSAELWTHNTRVAAVVHVTDAESGGAIEDAGRIADISARLGNLLRGQSDVHAGGGAGSPRQHKEWRLHQMMFNDGGGHADAAAGSTTGGRARRCRGRRRRHRPGADGGVRDSVRGARVHDGGGPVPRPAQAIVGHCVHHHRHGVHGAPWHCQRGARRRRVPGVLHRGSAAQHKVGWSDLVKML